MAQQTVEQQGTSIRLACVAFGISQTCYRYQAKQSAENVEIADHLVRLTHNQRNWGFGLCFMYLRNVKGYRWNHKRVSHLPRAGIEPAHQAQETHRPGEAGAIGGAGSHQPMLVYGFYA